MMVQEMDTTLFLSVGNWLFLLVVMPPCDYVYNFLFNPIFVNIHRPIPTTMSMAFAAQQAHNLTADLVNKVRSTTTSLLDFFKTHQVALTNSNNPNKTTLETNVSTKAICNYWQHVVFAGSVLWTEKIHRTELNWTMVRSIFRLQLPKFGVILVAGCLISKIIQNHSKTS